MKSHIKIYMLSLFFLTTCIGKVEAQICRNISVHLNEKGTYTLNPYQVVTPDLDPEYEPVIAQTFFTCDHLGVNAVDVIILFEEDTVFSCIANVEILDHEPPSAECVSNLHVVFDSNGEHTFTFEELDNGSHNVCDNFYYKIIPPVIKCGDHIPLKVQLVLQDYSGHFDTCTIFVTREEYPMPTVPIACPAMDTVTVFAGPLYENDPFPVTSDMILLGGPYGCPQNYFVQLSEGGNTRPSAILTNADTNKTLLARITDLETNEKCSTEIFVLGIPGCEVTFNICDTKCHNAPLGDCASGHTDLDGIEWPCDIVLMDVCPINLRVPTAELLSWMQPDVALDAFPQLASAYCDRDVFIGYYDKEFESPSPTSRRITREWTVLHWNLVQTWVYEQIIDIHFDITVICDTLPWNAQVGDCASGHTLTDDVEWPADISISSYFTHPDDLELNPEVDPKNVRPQLNALCNVASLDFIDLTTEINDSTLLIMRTWIVIDSYSEEEWQYTQSIQAKKVPDGSIVCVTREDGQPISGVVLVPGIQTDASGCHTFENPNGIIVTPSKSSPQEEGVNVLDMILMKEYLLGQRPLTFYQRRASDLSHSGGTSTLDLVMMIKLLQGILEPPLPKIWRFFEPFTHASSVDISDPNQSYKFIGIKTGDIDNSYFWGSQELEDIFLKAEDEILNNGETYQIPVYLSQNENVVGVSIRISNPNQNIEFLSVTSPDLPDFDSFGTVRFEPGEVTMIYVPPGLMLQQGVPVTTDKPFFTLEIKANDNLILNEELILDASFDNLLKPAGDNPALDVLFEWEDMIISSVLNPGQANKLQFYPNPAAEKIYFQGFKTEDQGVVNIIDATGRILATSPLQSSMDLQWLENGMYYMAVKLNSGETYTAPLLKLKS